MRVYIACPHARAPAHLRARVHKNRPVRIEKTSARMEKKTVRYQAKPVRI
jgi:hypothetical protein